MHKIVQNTCILGEHHYCSLVDPPREAEALHKLTLSPPTQTRLPTHCMQLLHTLTKRYLSVNTMLTSRTENTSLRVELSSENTSGCVFKVLPRYKVRSVGDVVGLLQCDKNMY